MPERLNKKVAIIGSGPAALMTAFILAKNNVSVTIIEKRKSCGRKLLVAGSSGLNITNQLPMEEFVKHYSGSKEYWFNILKKFSPQDWINFIEKLGFSTFLGTSGRYFIEDMKASRFLKAWVDELLKMGVHFKLETEWTGFYKTNFNKIQLTAITQKKLNQNSNQLQGPLYDAICLCLGGGSWEPNETPLRWVITIKNIGISFNEFTPSNVGYEVTWKKEFLKEAEGLPLKNIHFYSTKGNKKGDLTITSYGLEGTPIYFYGKPGTAYLDLKPDLTKSEILSKLNKSKENLSPLRRVKKYLSLCEASLALLFHELPEYDRTNLENLIERIKHFPISLIKPRPLTEAISSGGGIIMSELDENHMIKRFPGVFAAGEMLDWDAPTGGFLIQACVTQGYCAATGIINYLQKD